MRGRGFTLIELLVTVSVIGVLLSFLLPALTGARQGAMQTVGASNIRQLTLANAAYAFDRDARYAPAARSFTATNLHRWFGTRQTASEPFDPAKGELTPYLDGASSSDAVRACPRFAPVLDALQSVGAGFEVGAGGYGYNAGARRDMAGRPRRRGIALD